MTDQYTTAEVIEFADKMRGLGLEVGEWVEIDGKVSLLIPRTNQGMTARNSNSVANELIGIGLVGLAVDGDYYLWPISNGKWIVQQAEDPDLKEWKGDSPLAAVVAACEACLSLKGQQQ